MPTPPCFCEEGPLWCCLGRNVDPDIGDTLSKSGRRIGAMDICCEGCTDLTSLGAVATNAEMEATDIDCEGCMYLTSFGAVATNVGMGGTGGGGDDMVGLGGGER